MVAITGADIKWAQWSRVARNFQLRLGLKDRSRAVFDGFGREVRDSKLTAHTANVLFCCFWGCQDHDKIAQLLKQHFSVTLETKDVSFKGWNWGVTDIQGMLISHTRNRL